MTFGRIFFGLSILKVNKQMKMNCVCLYVLLSHMCTNHTWQLKQSKLLRHAFKRTRTHSQSIFFSAQFPVPVKTTLHLLFHRCEIGSTLYEYQTLLLSSFHHRTEWGVALSMAVAAPKPPVAFKTQKAYSEATEDELRISILLPPRRAITGPFVHTD